MVMTIITPLPKIPKPLIIPRSANTRPKAIRPPMITIGIKFRSTMPTGNPATRPPASRPTGMVTMPAKMPFAIAGLSSSFKIPIATGMVNTMVAPSILPQSTPPISAALGSELICCANGPPPISQAKIVPANIAGSAPKNRYTGTTTGFNRFASTGAKLIMPSIANAKVPMARMPSSKG